MDDKLGSAHWNYVGQQYASQDRLRARILVHERYTYPEHDFAGWVLDHVPWHGGEWVIDVGAGDGQYARAARGRCGAYIAADLYQGMLRQLNEPGLIRVNLDAAALPLRRNCADVVLANHMLYYVDDLDKACRGFARVLRPGGVLLAATNSERYMGELKALHGQVAAQFGYADRLGHLDVGRPFTLENGHRELTRHFDQVDRFELASELRFPTAQPVIDYLASSGSRLFDLLPDGLAWVDVACALRHELEARIADRGSFCVSKLAGVFVCR